jgi:hypothetical protein
MFFACSSPIWSHCRLYSDALGAEQAEPSVLVEPVECLLGESAIVAKVLGAHPAAPDEAVAPEWQWQQCVPGWSRAARLNSAPEPRGLRCSSLEGYEGCTIGESADNFRPPLR